MRDEVGDLGVALLRAVKATLDPTGILNPGKLIP
jgi:alkyldihydroxyacetonephosphate synthase